MNYLVFGIRYSLNFQKRIYSVFGPYSLFIATLENSSATSVTNAVCVQNVSFVINWSRIVGCWILLSGRYLSWIIRIQTTKQKYFLSLLTINYFNPLRPLVIGFNELAIVFYMYVNFCSSRNGEISNRVKKMIGVGKDYVSLY